MTDGGKSRDQISLRGLSSIYPKLQQVADVETEGNVSQTIRKLLNEALAARRAASAPPRNVKRKAQPKR